jgi:hypothetical protein
MLTGSGKSKGCGYGGFSRLPHTSFLDGSNGLMYYFALFLISVIEYRFPEDAQRAIRTLHNAVFMGRPVLVREVRDTSSLSLIYYNQCS